VESGGRGHPDMSAAHFNLAQVCEGRGIVEAIGAYRGAMRLSGPSAAGEHLAIARLLEQRGLDAGARAELAAALREDPTSREACEKLERLSERQGTRGPAARVLVTRFVTHAKLRRGGPWARHAGIHMQ
jgi:hypothetical protein